VTDSESSADTATRELRHAVQRWLADDPDPETRVELEALMDRLPDSAAELTDRFSGPLTFGTAGLRGPVRAGPNGMNRAVVRGAAAGLMAYLWDSGARGPLVIGYDARTGSAAFAQETAAVCTGAGREALLLPGLLPTPVLAFAVRKLGAAAGVMVTASHNPSADNGYKVYLADGAQLAPPADEAIEAAIRAVPSLIDVPLGPPGRELGPEVLESYLDAVAGLVDPSSARELSVAYTPMHGVGGATMVRAFERAGFAAPSVVAEQADPDPRFPTVAFPNPEEPGATDLLLALAENIHADLAIASDPDADRCAVAVPLPGGGWRQLTGDEVGILLADHVMRRGATDTNHTPGTYATTIVSSSMLRALCERRGLPYAETLTGFKWIVRAAPNLAYGYEEALGYAVAPGLVRDKDGISAALLVAELAASLRPRTLLDRLDELAAEVGVYLTGAVSIRVDDLAEIGELMAGLRAALPEQLVGRPVESAEDLWPDTDAVILRAGGLRVVARPSGTEPKLKLYLEVHAEVTTSVAEARATATADLASLEAEVRTAFGA
jgi:phosphomannomutase